MSEVLSGLLACPRDHLPVRIVGVATLVCANGHRYPIVEGIPVMLRDDVQGTLGVENSVLHRARNGAPRDGPAAELHLETLGLTAAERDEIAFAWRAGNFDVDPAVQFLVAATCGIAYKGLKGRLHEYPIPNIQLPPSQGEIMLDIGCNWGRWSIASSRIGYRVIGVDPQLGALLAARRVAEKMGLQLEFICADARYLPLIGDCVDVAYSYSVLQHFSRDDCQLSVAEISRVLRRGGRSRIQMANALGVRSAYHLARRRFRQTRRFEVRYYTPNELKGIFARIGETRLEADCYFGLGLQGHDLHLLSGRSAWVVRASEAAKRVALGFPPLKWFADSLFVESTKSP